MPKMIFAHGWWLSGSTKMSKSLGNVVNPMDYAENYGVDAFRYFLIAEMTLGQDASFTHDVFTRRYNAELANDLGNLASRVLKMLKSNFDGVLPEVSEGDLQDPEREVWAAAQTAVAAMSDHVDTMRLDLGIAAAITAVRETNKYLEFRKPWLQAKDEDKRPLEISLYTAAEILRVVSALLSPVMPEKMAELRKALGMTEVEPHLERLKVWGGLKAGSQSEPVLLFPRIQEEKKQEQAKPVKKESKKKIEGVLDVSHIEFDEFKKVELKTAKVFAAEKVPDALKLLRLEVFVGEERRQIVAGIAQHYEPEDLIGKTIVIVANLKPAKIRGVESQGMLLAASAGERLKLVTVDGELASGASVG